MRRREFIAVLGSAVTWPMVTRAQQPGESAEAVAAFRRGLAESGFVEGGNVSIEFRWADGQYDRLPALAADLVRRQVAAIVAAGGGVSTLAAKAATQTIPIVFIVGDLDPSIPVSSPISTDRAATSRASPLSALS
jgi:putative ABC transport system substrate-binding protein